MAEKARLALQVIDLDVADDASVRQAIEYVVRTANRLDVIVNNAGASKFALEGLTEAYRYELAALGIDAVIVEPTTYPTHLVANSHEPVDKERIAPYAAVMNAVAPRVGATVMNAAPPETTFFFACGLLRWWMWAMVCTFSKGIIHTIGSELAR